MKGTSDHWDQGKEYALEKSNEYRTQRYHQPSDEYNETFNIDGIVQDAELFYNITKDLANSNDWPKWKEGSEFKSIREK